MNGDSYLFFFFQAEDGIRDSSVTGVQTCALPIWRSWGTWRGSVKAGKQESRKAEQQNSRTAEQQNSRTAGRGRSPPGPGDRAVASARAVVQRLQVRQAGTHAGGLQRSAVRVARAQARGGKQLPLLQRLLQRMG